jgi:polar amino acid transport system substrate-binding protein/glutamate/aspartate transport system substrate-binding protein
MRSLSAALKNYKLLLASLVLVSLGTVLPAAASTVLGQAQARGTLRLLWITGAQPFSYEVDGQPAGYEIDLCRRIANLVAPGLKIEWQAVGLAQGLQQITQGQGDLLCGPITITLGRMAQMDFTSPVYIGGPGVLLNNDASPLLAQWLDPAQPQMPSMRSLQLETAAPRRIAVQQGSTGAAWLQDKIAQQGLDVTVILVPNDTAAARLLAAGAVEGWVSERAVLASTAAHDPGLGDCRLLPRTQSGEPLAIAMPKDAQFSIAVEAALAKIVRSPDFDTLIRSWFGPASGDDAVVIRSVTPLE